MKHTELKNGVETIRAAVEVRTRITELYTQYRQLQAAAHFAAQIKPGDLKRAVDAHHYLGGGWPTEGSKGRMEALIDNFAGMYKVLAFEGSEIADKHLAEHGLKVTIEPGHAIKNGPVTEKDLDLLHREFGVKAFGVDRADDLSSLVAQLISACDMIQTDICQLADDIRDGLRPQAKNLLGIDDEEYDRLHGVVKFTMAGEQRDLSKADKIKVDTAASVSGYNQALGLVGTVLEKHAE